MVTALSSKIQNNNKKVLYRLEKLERYYVSQAEIVKAVDGIDLEIKQGEFLAIFGPSGSGKTTLLNILAGLDTPTGGNISFEEKDYSKLNDNQLCQIRRHDIGIIFQFYNMHPSFTARENIEYPMMIANVPKEDRYQKSTKLLELMGLVDKAENFPSELSGGEKQRIGIARALANDPKIIIADEPTGDLDSDNAKDIIEILLSLYRERKKTIVMVTHDESITTKEMRILRLKDGKIK